jgi:C-terminal processing protease CtpA/Prc
LLHALRSHYSFTELKGIDWDQLEKKYADQVNAAREVSDFVSAIGPMLSELCDIHVWVESADGRRQGFHQSSFRANDDHRIVRSRLDDVETFEGIGFVGRVGKIGVAVITGLPSEGDYGGLQAAIRNRSTPHGFVMDLRRNSGGSESRAAEIAGLFTSRRTKYARTQRRGPDGLIEVESRYLNPTASHPIDVPVVCLIGPGCVSSGEGFALMMKSLEQVTLIGQPTRGASGNPQPVLLSNGVRVWFSRWSSLELDGTPIEMRGVTPETLVQHIEGRDEAFDRALERLHQP